MSRREEFEVGPDVRVDIEVRAGSVDVRSATAGRVVITIDSHSEGDWDVSHVGNTVTARPGWGWRSRSARISVEVPPGSGVDVRGASADIALLGDLGSVRVRTQSGDLRADSVAGLDVSTASGNVRVDDCTGRATIATVSGDTELTTIGDELALSSASGDLTARRVGGDVHVSTMSGDVHIGSFEGGDLAVKTVAGDVRLGLPTGIRVVPNISTLSGRTRLPSPVPAPPEAGERRIVRLSITTVSGNITIDRA